MAEAGEEHGEEPSAPKKPKMGGRSAALRIIRENVERVNKELSSFRKTHDASSKKLEKQVAALRSEIAALKSHIARENARAREKTESLHSKILAKLNSQKSSKPSVSAPRKKSAPKKKSKGKK